MKVRCFFLMGLLMIFSSGAYAVNYSIDLDWMDGGVYRAFDHNTNALSWGTGDGLSSLVQLIYAGADNQIDFAGTSGSGTLDDDFMVAYSYMGVSQPPLAGIFDPANFTIGPLVYNNGAVFYMRIWEGVSPNPGTGDAPVTLGSYYGNSDTFTVSFSTTAPTFESLYLQSDLITGLQSVPEPSTMALMALGMASVGFYRRRKKSL